MAPSATEGAEKRTENAPLLPRTPEFAAPTAVAPLLEEGAAGAVEGPAAGLTTRLEKLAIQHVARSGTKTARTYVVPEEADADADAEAEPEADTEPEELARQEVTSLFWTVI